MSATELLILLVVVVLPLALLGGGFWFALRYAGRPCPRCGRRVANGVSVCESCGYDLSAGGAPPAARR